MISGILYKKEIEAEVPSSITEEGKDLAARERREPTAQKRKVAAHLTPPNRHQTLLGAAWADSYPPIVPRARGFPAGLCTLES
jgi:hypothetical protein